ncbi:shikimate dehydrogenase [Hydrogenispora ethanolica]|jgi:shikimate dehydrogenase|uniref:Shikimate dehydrogenase (NADP(+)) n=1 Tax=Hydrogenispora ethanolica TaxID=1082276 RepID=A0A4R1QTR2_HYDET|nr:shikimate dehydrogenase [Hydrogenispora ethanolica]TCL56493.1 shikimate dehydrogenase [Hydrogenispora ethanolica]
MNQQRITGSTAVYGVFGDPVAHSLSPVMQNAAFAELNVNGVYLPFHVTLSQLPAAVQGIRALGIQGINLTIPLKQAVIPELDEIVGDSLQSGSVNTIMNRNGRLIGTSTDGSGFIQSLREDGQFDPTGKNILMLGAGGSAAALLYRLVASNVRSITVVNRDPKRVADLRDQVRDRTGFEVILARLDQLEALDWSRFQLLINTTSVGLHEDASLVQSKLFHERLLVYDLVYRKGDTRLINEARQAGCPTLTGLSLLLYQGAQSFSLWLDREAPIAKMRQVLETYQA